MHGHLGLVAGAALVFAASLGDVRAAPQVLGLVASAGAVSLICDGDDCAAEFTSFCLQESRPAPRLGAVYRAVGGEGLAVTGTIADGTEVALPADTGLRITAVRGYSAVRIGLPRAVLDALGLRRVRVAVGEGVSLVPEPEAGDPDPLGDDEVAAVTGSLRLAGTRLVDQGNEEVEAARLTGALINALPVERRVDSEVRRGLWDKVFAASPPARASAGAVTRAGAAYAHCNAAIGWRTAMFTTLRDCLAHVHDQFIGQRNRLYWEAVRNTS